MASAPIEDTERRMGVLEGNIEKRKVGKKLERPPKVARSNKVEIVPNEGLSNP